MMRFLGSFFSTEDAEMREYKGIWGKTQDFNNSKSKEMLKIEYRAVSNSLTEQVNQLITSGQLKQN